MRTPPPDKGTRRLTRLALLTAIALTIFMVEAQIPVPIPIPGVKLGLANIVTVYAVFVLGPWDALSILVVRVFLGAVFSGQMMTLFYSLGGGLLCWVVLVLLRRLFTKNQIWLCSPVSAIFHNLGQLLVAAALMGTWVVLGGDGLSALSGDRRGGQRPVYRPVRPVSHRTAGQNLPLPIMENKIPRHMPRDFSGCRKSGRATFLS